MSPLDAQRLFSTDVERATEEILRELHRKSHIYKVFYVDCWNGFGATAVLRSIAAVLPSRRTTPELCFDRILYIDCSEWKSRRATQRAIAEELKLDSSVIAILDKQDEEDDFSGVDQGSRDVVQSVAAVIHSTLISTRFIMIFLNGTDDEFDITIFGIPQITEFRNNIMIWTFKRRSLTINLDISEIISKLRYTRSINQFVPGIKGLSNAQFETILLEEVNTIVDRNPCMLGIDCTMIAECYLYELFLHYNFNTTNKFYWAGHAPNYWICDGIIQGDKAWDITNAFHREINWMCDSPLLFDFLKQFMEPEPPFMAVKDDDVYHKGPYRWISVTSKNRKSHGLQTIPAATSSFFWASEGSGHPSTLPNGLFEHSNKLRVLVLCTCAFNFASPPFGKCHNLRFLGLDHCTDDKSIEGDDLTGWLCLYNLWVLDLRHTDWNEILSQEKMDRMSNIRELCIEGVRGWMYTADLQGRLPNLQRLRIIKPTCPWKTSNDAENSFTDKTSMEILDLSGNSDMENIPTSLSKASGLQMLILDGCDGLGNIVALGRLPPSLRSFSFDGYGPAFQRTQTAELPPKHFRRSTVEGKKDISTSKISLEGCTQLDNLFLRELNNLVELDLSGTAIKILDFKTMVVHVPRLRRLFLIGCENLRAIIPVHETRLELMCIDTRARIMCPRPSIGKTKPFRLHVHAIIVDARLTRSLEQSFFPYIKKGYLWDIYYNIHVTSSPVYDGVVQFEATNKDKLDKGDQGSLQQFIPAGQYSDVLSMVGNPLMQAFPQPPTTRLDRHIEIANGSCYVESGLEAEGELGYLMGLCTNSLYLHDVSIHATVPNKDQWLWDHLRWCCVERCPKLDTVFGWRSGGFPKLETFWASDLLMARWIWSKGSRAANLGCGLYSFRHLQHLHLRSCPSLQFVIPVWVSSFANLETLHIIHCGDLVHVFELDGLYPEEIISLGVVFPKLTTIHIHDVPKLRQICEVKMVAPALETIKIRGCWGLRRLPSVSARARGAKKPTIEIEKDVWDALDWDANNRPDHFEAPVHSRYYKKKLPRISFLR